MVLGRGHEESPEAPCLRTRKTWFRCCSRPFPTVTKTNAGETWPTKEKAFVKRKRNPVQALEHTLAGAHLLEPSIEGAVVPFDH